MRGSAAGAVAARGWAVEASNGSAVCIQGLRPAQRAELDRLLGWCLATAIAPDGTVVTRAKSESLAEGYYFTITFLDTVGYFDPAKRSWTDRALPEAPALRARLECHVRRLHNGDPMARMARERLSPP